MKLIYFFILFTFAYINSAFQSVCYVGNLKFGEENCLSNTTKEIPADVLDEKRFCKEIACMPYLKDFEANICFQQKEIEIEFFIVYKNMTHEMYKISTFKEKDTYELKSVAISGTNTRNSHITLRMVSGESVYRLAFNVKYLTSVKSNEIPLQNLGLNNIVVWQPFLNYDQYHIIDHDSGIYKEHFKEYFNKSKENSTVYEISESLQNKEECTKWSAIIPNETTTILSLLTTTTTVSISATLNAMSIIGLILAIVGIIIFICCIAAILISLCCYFNRKKNFVISAQNDGNDFPVEIVAHAPLPLLSEPPLPSPPPTNIDESNTHNNADTGPQAPPHVPELSQSTFAAPPPDERLRFFGQLYEGFIQYANFRNRNSGITLSPIDMVEMQTLRQSQNDLAVP